MHPQDADGNTIFSMSLPFVGLAFLSPSFANDPEIAYGAALVTRIRSGDVACSIPFILPSREDILKKLPVKARTMNARGQCELILYRVNEPRFYPVVGQARLVEVRFKCTVTTDRKREVIYIDRDQVIPKQVIPKHVLPLDFGLEDKHVTVPTPGRW
jgi:hypothetical protein